MSKIERRARRRWGLAWVGLSLALAVHVVDEALSDFLPFWNSLVGAARDRLPWVPLPTFAFSEWLGGLIVGVVLLLSLSRFAFEGARWMRPLSYFLAVVMLGNGLGHIAASVYLGRLAPGVVSSPLLLLAAALLLVATRQSSGPDIAGRSETAAAT